MTREHLQRLILEGLDEAQNHPFIVRLTAEQRDVLAAGRMLVQTDAATLDKWLALLPADRQTGEK